LKILPPLITHNSDGSYTKEVLEYFERWFYEPEKLWWKSNFIFNSNSYW
jgi:hypothetical protein